MSAVTSDPMEARSMDSPGKVTGKVTGVGCSWKSHWRCSMNLRRTEIFHVNLI